MAVWDIKKKVYNHMFDYSDTCQLIPHKNIVEFHIISDPGEVTHDVYMDVKDCREFANYLLTACDKCEYITKKMKELRLKHKGIK